MGLTCADGDGFYELVSPTVGSYQQSQVGFLYQLVHSVLPKDKRKPRLDRRHHDEEKSVN